MNRSVNAILGGVIASWSMPALVFCAPAIAAADSVAAEPAAAAEPDPVRLEILREDLARARWARVTGAGRQFELAGPRAGMDGVGFTRAKGFPAPPQALFGGPEPPTPPPNPLRWSSIERIEVQEQHWGPGAPLGAGLGLWGGAIVGVTAAWIIGYSTGSRTAAYITLAAVPIGFGVLGAYAMGSRSEWVEVYPTRTVHPQDASATSARAVARQH
jgi:hypothetical protein